MKIFAVICELNPLHKGHQALLAHAKSQGAAVVCVLSGNFVQRGDAAIIDKWARTRLALQNGADLVIELPLLWACASAERFAAGGVALADALGCVDELLFGCETEDVDLLTEIARTLLTPDFTAALKALPDAGETFAKRREQALVKLLGEDVRPVLQSPNAILGIEYIKAITAQGAAITPRAFLRQGAGHGEAAQGGEFASAGELRAKILCGENVDTLVPESTAAVMGDLKAAGAFPTEMRLLERSILCKLRTLSAEEFAALPDVSEGLENRLYAAARQAGSLEEFYTLVKSKRYSLARIRRLTLYAFLGLRAPLPALPPYLRVLGMNSTGEAVLRAAKPSLPILTRPKDLEKLGDDAGRVFELEAMADDLYGLAAPVPRPCGRDYTEKLIRL